MYSATLNTCLIYAKFVLCLEMVPGYVRIQFFNVYLWLSLSRDADVKAPNNLVPLSSRARSVSDRPAATRAAPNLLDHVSVVGVERRAFVCNEMVKAMSAIVKTGQCWKTNADSCCWMH